MSFAGCGEASQSSDSSASTANLGPIATALVDEFQTSASGGTDTATLADQLSKNACFGEIAMGTMDVEEGSLNGFDAEITGFSKGTMFSPMIGSMPFVGYVFETDDVDALKETLKAHAQLNWNVCTTADDMAIESDSDGKLVLFVMAPKSFDE